MTSRQVSDPPPSDLPAWGQAGLSNDDQLDRQVFDSWLRPAAIRVDGERLIWSYRPAPEPLGRAGGYVKPSVGLLTDFVELAEAEPTAVCDFARRWGVLRLCKQHDMPSTHAPSPLDLAEALLDALPNDLAEARRTGWFGGCALRQGADDEYWEPLEGWRRYSLAARALLNLAARLHQNQKGELLNWQALGRTLYREHGSTGNEARAEVSDQRVLLALALNGWLRDGQVTAQFHWGSEATTITLGGRSLFGALGIQLILAIGKTDGLAYCAACGSSFSPQSRARNGWRRYCQGCRQHGRPKRDAARAYRQRLAEARRLHTKGRSLKDIAQVVGRPTAAVKRWVTK